MLFPILPPLAVYSIMLIQIWISPLRRSTEQTVTWENKFRRHSLTQTTKFQSSIHTLPSVNRTMTTGATFTLLRIAVVQSLSCVQLFETPRTATRQPPLSPEVCSNSCQ